MLQSRQERLDRGRQGRESGSSEWEVALEGVGGEKTPLGARAAPFPDQGGREGGLWTQGKRLRPCVARLKNGL